MYTNNIFSEIIHDILMKIRRRKKNLTNIWQPFLNLYRKAGTYPNGSTADVSFPLHRKHRTQNA